MKVAILGFGTVGYGVWDMLKNKDGIEVAYVLDIKKHPELGDVSVTDYNTILNDKTVSTVIELIGGLHPAFEFIKSALECGKNVVTANKFAVCENYEVLTKLALKNKVALRYTAAVGGGIQWLYNLERMIKSDTAKDIVGIMNGTTNFILDKMHTENCDFNDALKEAQALGYAEADPSADTEGLDTMRKAVITASVAFGTAVSPNMTDVMGISSVYSDDINAAKSMGCVIRLLANAKRNRDGISVYVEPSFVKDNSIFAGVEKNLNYISVSSEFAGISGFFGYGAGRYPTAYTVVNDCIDILHGINRPYNNVCEKICVDNSKVLQKYYVRTAVKDEWLNAVTGEKLSGGVITKAISVNELHKNIKRISSADLGTFAAAIRTEV